MSRIISVSREVIKDNIFQRTTSVGPHLHNSQKYINTYKNENVYYKTVTSIYVCLVMRENGTLGKFFVKM